MAIGAVAKPGKTKFKSAGAKSPLLSIAMTALLLVHSAADRAPFLLAIFYAFSDARIGTEMDLAHFWRHLVGLENFRSILQSPSFRTALKNSIIFTVAAQVIVMVCANILSIALEKPFRGRGLVRFLILLPWLPPLSLGTIRRTCLLHPIYTLPPGCWSRLDSSINILFHCGWDKRGWPSPQSFWCIAGG
jgi:ABC-type sugar transport system permease subunit